MFQLQNLYFHAIIFQLIWLLHDDVVSFVIFIFYLFLLTFWLLFHLSSLVQVLPFILSLSKHVQFIPFLYDLFHSSFQQIIIWQVFYSSFTVLLYLFSTLQFFIVPLIFPYHLHLILSFHASYLLNSLKFSLNYVIKLVLISLAMIYWYQHFYQKQLLQIIIIMIILFSPLFFYQKKNAINVWLFLLIQYHPSLQYPPFHDFLPPFNYFFLEVKRFFWLILQVIYLQFQLYLDLHE